MALSNYTELKAAIADVRDLNEQLAADEFNALVGL